MKARRISPFLLLVAGWLASITPAVGADEPAEVSLWPEPGRGNLVGGLRGMRAVFEGGVLRLAADLPPPASAAYSWASLPAPVGGWPLGRRATVEADVSNTGAGEVDFMLWVVGESGWDAVPAAAKLGPGETRRLSCRLRETFPDGTPKIDPARVSEVRVMVRGRFRAPVRLEVRGLVARGEEPVWTPPANRVAVPSVTDESPAPGRRVRIRLEGDPGGGPYAVLHLPEDWRPGVRLPLIVEYPGNIFFVPGCYSTGLPEQCVIGAGLTRGRGAICLALPFVDRAAGVIAEGGWGVPDDTAAYAVAMVEHVVREFAADPDNVVLTGFSRGALACGFIGLRDERIAALWKGFHACQHYDGDGWNGATEAGALERARRFRGRAVFQTDNSRAKFQRVMDAMSVPVTWADSGLGAHATAMFLDDRPSTQALRRWFNDLVAAP
ncbi:MAG: hypothetical protein RLZZ188_2344 [Verrucomicrobiota bacterium]